MRRIATLGVVLMLSATGCLFGGGEDVRTVLVDFSHDEFASFAIANFPEKVSVRPGTNLVFRQTWTGEPHTVTGGALVDEAVVRGQGWMRFFEAFEALGGSGASLPNPDDPGDATAAEFADAIREADDEGLRDELLGAWDALREEGASLPDLADPGDMSFQELVALVDEESEQAFEGLPWALDEDEEGDFFIPQNAGQPCYLTEGMPPEDPDTPCDDEAQEKPVFDGTQSYYNSGIIPYEGQGGNTFEVQLADDIEPGGYMFYCAVHGFSQATEVEVVEEGVEVSSEEEITREARGEIDEVFGPLEELFRAASSEGAVEIEGERLEGPFAGLLDPSVDHAAINEFVPRKLTVQVDEPITWKMMALDHTITFDVPEYFPIMEFSEDGRVRLNPRLIPPAGGAPEPPEGGGEGEGPLRVDGGTYDGEGFWSSGLIGAEPYIEYTLRISEPGTYRYACLIHPAMVGTVEVT